MKAGFGYLIFSAAAVALIGAACSQGAAPPTATPSPQTPTATPSPVPTATPEPTATPTPEPTATSEPASAMFRYMHGVNLLNAAQWKDAIPQFDLVIRLIPDFAEAYYYRAVAFHKEEKGQLALEDLTKAIELKPEYPQAYRDRGVLLAKCGEAIAGRADLNRSLSLFEKEGDNRGANEVRMYLASPQPTATLSCQ